MELVIIDEVNSRNALLLRKEMSELGLRLNRTKAGRTLYSEGHISARASESELNKPTFDPKKLEILINEYSKISETLKC